MSRPITAVHVDIARFLLEVSQVSALSADSADKILADWTRGLARCLALRDPALHEYGAYLLNEVEGYRRAEIARKAEKFPRNPRTSAESADSLPRSSITDQSNTDLKNNGAPPAAGAVGDKAKRKPKTFEPESDPMRLAAFFAKFYADWARGAKPVDPAKLQSWAAVFDAMLRIDGRTVDGIGAMLNAIDLEKPPKTGDFLWRNNILSPKTLRDRWNEGKLGKFLEGHHGR